MHILRIISIGTTCAIAAVGLLFITAVVIRVIRRRRGRAISWVITLEQVFKYRITLLSLTVELIIPAGLNNIK